MLASLREPLGLGVDSIEEAISGAVLEGPTCGSSRRASGAVDQLTGGLSSGAQLRNKSPRDVVRRYQHTPEHVARSPVGAAKSPPGGRGIGAGSHHHLPGDQLRNQRISAREGRSDRRAIWSKPLDRLGEFDRKDHVRPAPRVPYAHSMAHFKPRYRRNGPDDPAQGHCRGGVGSLVGRSGRGTRDVGESLVSAMRDAAHWLFPVVPELPTRLRCARGRHRAGRD